MNSKLAFVCVLLACLAAATAYAAPPACQFNALPMWAGRVAQWHGSCQNGLAQGLGMLPSESNPRQPKQPVQLFYGEMKSGNPALGVIDAPGGFIAGEFKGGQADENSNRQDITKAFRVASAAAAAESKRYSEAGNHASSRFYAAKAIELSQQLD